MLVKFILVLKYKVEFLLMKLFSKRIDLTVKFSKCFQQPEQ